ncbi:MAG: Ig-like domain repeat protein [Acidobacteriota bacterium]
MILQFRKHIIPQLTVAAGLCAGLLLSTGVAHAQVATRTQLAAQNNSGTLSFTAKVADVQGTPVSEGSVSFETAKGSLGSVFVKEGAATLNLTNAPKWATTVTAVYHGDAAFANSTASTQLSADATSGVPGFTVTANPSSLTLPAGQYGTVSLTVTSQNGFSEPVNLSCSGLPGSSQCVFNPVVITPPANGSATSALQITTSAASGIYSSQVRSERSGTLYAMLIPGALALLGIGAIRRKNYRALRALGLVALLAAGTLGLTACNIRYNYIHYKPGPNPGTGAGNYTIVVAAYATNGTAITNATSSDAACSGAVCVALTVQ